MGADVLDRPSESGSLLLEPRLGTPRSATRSTFGPQVAEVARVLGLPLTPWQRHVADVALEYEMVDLPVYSEGVLIYTVQVPQLVYREVRLWVPRQSGKTVLLLALLTWRCLFAPDLFYPDRDEFFGRAAQWVTFFSTHGQHAKHKWEDEHVPIMTAAKELEGEFAVRRNNGHEAFLWTNESLWQLGSSTEKAAHGDSGDTIAADEFFAQVDDRIENGARPTMITRRSPQIWFVSTFGDTKDVKENMPGISEPLWRKVDDSRERCRRYAAGDVDAHGAVATFEYSAADVDDGTLDYGDPELWRRTMPGLQCNGGIIPESAIEADFNSMTLAAFKRAYLNLRQPRGDNLPPPVISERAWADVVTTKTRLLKPRVNLAMGVDIDFEDREAAITIVGKSELEGRRHLELMRGGEGSDWLLDEIARLLVRHDIRDLGLDAGGPTSRYLTEIAEICKRQRVTLHKYSGRSYAAACEAFRLGVMQQTVANHGQATLAAAVDNGMRKSLADVWVWDRRTASAPIAALVSATVGLRAHEEGTAKERRSAYDEVDETDEDEDVRPSKSAYEEV